VKLKDLVQSIKKKRSFLCVGLDSHIEKLPQGISKDINGLLTFNKAIIEATSDLAVSYKINTAFYEQYGKAGWEVMEQTLALIPDDCFTIADAKRGDIGNTSSMYAKAFFEQLNFDSITVSPYMGEDSVRPFMEYDKTVIVLALTSNKGSSDFQHLESDSKPLYQHVLERVASWSSPENLMFVVGATRSEHFLHIREIVPNHFLLVPGVGRQGGSLSEVAKYGLNKDCGLLINSSRGIIFSSDGEDFAASARKEALLLQQQMDKILD